MRGKMARSAAHPPFPTVHVAAAVRATACLARTPENRKNSHWFGGSYGESRLVVLDVVDVVAEPHVHLGSVDVEAEEIRRRIDVGGLQGAGAAVDDRYLRLGLRIIVHGDSFRTRKRGD